MMIVYLIVVLSIIFGLASLAVDYGRVQLAKTQLQTATDVAVKWAAQATSGGNAELLARANEVAGDNPVNGETVAFAAGDVQSGSWNAATRTFTANASPNNAVRLSVSHVVPLLMGGVIQKPSVTIRASAIAKRRSTGGLVGLSGIAVKNNLFVGSYSSAVTTSPTEATAQSNATISSNGVIESSHNGVVKGDVTYGPSGGVDVDTWTVSGQTSQLAAPVTAPPEGEWNPTGNPGSTPQVYTHNGGTLQAGNYYFTSLTINDALSFAGPAKVYVNGNVVVDGNTSITAHAGRPGNLTIYQIGAGRTFTTKNATSIKAVIIAPRAALVAENKISLYGQFTFDTVTLKNTASFFYDESAGSSSQAVELVQ